MSFIPAEEFRQKTIASPNRQEKRYQNRLLNAGPVFSKQNKELAIKYCQNYNQKKQLCLVVEEQHYFQIWYEEKNSASHSQIETETTQNINCNKNFTESITIDPIFVDRCQQILLDLIGPIASVICKRTAEQNPNIKRNKFIEIIVKQIPESQKAENFKIKLLELE